ncbi:MAG: hypothetical protein QOJ92_2172 [Frankiales bacterium]|nr:hypothetical protein [Frankiales bacterium]
MGGGHGLAMSLAALRRVTDRVTAVVTVADDGGSSGRLRTEIGALPPGDLRMALAALAGDDSWGATWSDLLQHRFSGSGPLAGHAVGNLVISGLCEVTGDPVAALDLVAQLVGAAGRVLPLSTTPLDIVAEVVGLDPRDPGAVSEVRGQVKVATTPGRVVAVHLVPDSPPACVEAVRAVEAADVVVLGPGSWFSSVLPHLLVPDLAKALVATEARKVVALNLSPQPGETDGFSPETHLEVLAAHLPELGVDVVLADPRAVPQPDRLRDAAAELGASLVLADVGRRDGSPVHDPELLAAALRPILGAAR